jgi:WhiB family transcriptional regulator, redox-sensing transcriptional regulator
MRSATQADTAACQDADPEIFFPGRGHDARAAKAVCARCPVASECLEYALKDEDAFLAGVWGGTTPKEGRGLQRASQKRQLETNQARRKPVKRCSYCGARAVAHGLCQLHYGRERRRKASA